MLNLALCRFWLIRQIDVNNVFLNGDLIEDVYMEQSLGFQTVIGMVYKLKKTLYGLKETPRAWFSKLNLCLIGLGFQASKSDTSLFLHHSFTFTLIVLVYVNEILIIESDAKDVQQLIDKLDFNFALKNLGLLNYFLGV